MLFKEVFDLVFIGHLFHGATATPIIAMSSSASRAFDHLTVLLIAATRVILGKAAAPSEGNGTACRGSHHEFRVVIVMDRLVLINSIQSLAQLLLALKKVYFQGSDSLTENLNLLILGLQFAC